MQLFVARYWLVGSLVLAGCAEQAADEVVAGAASLEPTVAFTVPEPDLLPENVAFDPVDGAFYLGSTRKGKIVRIRADGTVDDFIAPRQDGLWMVIGMKVDPVRRVLWVCSSGGDNLEGDWDRTAPGSAGVFQFDLTTGRLLARATLAGGPVPHFFNDLALTPAGDAFVTHMFGEAAIYRVRAGSDQLELWSTLPDESFPNGITFGPGGRLYVALRSGIASIDTATRALEPVPAPEGVSTRGVDGLYAWGEHLLGVRSGVPEVRRYRLGPDGRSIVESMSLVDGHATFSNPTTAVLVADTLFVVANSHFQLVGSDGSLPDTALLTPPVILRVPIR
jgi:sugar lactone lactonase YvrE